MATVRMGSVFIILIILGLITPSLGQASKNIVYTYTAMINGTPRAVTLTVEEAQHLTTVSYYNEFGEKETSTFTDQTKLQSAKYFDADGKEMVGVNYDYEHNKIEISGVCPAHYPYRQPTYDNNGALFYLLTLLQPKPGQRYTFYMCQSNLTHIEDDFSRGLITNWVGPVEMYFKYVSDEDITVGNKTYSTRKYEMGVNVPTIALFWPNKYYFWISQQDQLLVQFQGPNNKNHIDTYQLATQTALDNNVPVVSSLPESPAGVLSQEVLKTAQP